MHFSVPRKSWIFSKIWQIVLVLISPLVLSAIFVIILYIVPVIISSMVMIQYGKFLIFLYNCQWHCVNHYRKVNHGLYFLAVSDISWILFLMLLTRYLSSYFSILCVIVIVPNNTQQPRFCVVAGAGPEEIILILPTHTTDTKNELHCLWKRKDEEWRELRPT